MILHISGPKDDLSLIYHYFRRRYTIIFKSFRLKKALRRYVRPLSLNNNFGGAALMKETSKPTQLHVDHIWRFYDDILEKGPRISAAIFNIIDHLENKSSLKRQRTSLKKSELTKFWESRKLCYSKWKKVKIGQKQYFLSF